MENNPEVDRLFERWIDRTIEIHHEELTKLGVGDTEDLRRSVQKHFRRMGDGYLEGGMTFLKRGRFVDMGSGRGYSHGRRTGGNSFDMDEPRTGKIRKPKKWYSKVFYGRLNDLQGALGFKLMEEAVDQAKEEFLKA